MKVKIGGRVYDSSEQMIMVILSEADKQNIANMHPKAMNYCTAPAQTSEEEMRRFMLVKKNGDDAAWLTGDPYDAVS